MRDDKAQGMIDRRGFITGLVSLVAAPAIVRVSSLMPVKSFGEIADSLIVPAPRPWVTIEDSFLRTLFGILEKHPQMTATQIMELCNQGTLRA
jgi:hypothetical protein